MNPVFYEKTKDGEVFYDVSSRLIKDRVIFLSEPVTEENAGVISSLLFMLNNESKEDKISLWINTFGGDAYAFSAIYDMIQIIQAPVETVCIGKAMSAGCLLMASGTKGMRLATPNSKFMMHQMQVSEPAADITSFEVEFNHSKNLNEDLMKIFANHTGQTFEKVMKDCSRNLYLSAQQALKYGIIDKIIPISKKVDSTKKTASVVPRKRNK